MNGHGFPPEGTPLGQGAPVQQPVYPTQQQGYPQQGQPYPQQQQAPVQQPPQAPAPQQHPTVGQHFPQQGQQQAPQQPAQQQTPQQQRMAQLDDDVVLDGPGVPPELRGRRWSQVKAIYNELADDYARRHFAGGQQQQQAQPQQQPVQQYQQQPVQQPVQQQQPVQPQEDPRRRLFSDPQGLIQDEVRKAIEPLQQAIQPVVQHTQQSQAMGARQRVAQRIPDWQQLEPEIIRITSTAQPQALMREDFWEAAADLARGRMAGRQVQQQQNGQLLQPQPGIPSVPSYQAGFPQTQQFFTEAPTAPSVYQASYQGTLNPAESAVAKSMGMTDAEYLAWKGGVK